jgi:VanZ family protein
MLFNMKMIRFSLVSMVLLACLAAVVALTTMPLSVNVIRAVKQISVIEGHPNANDALGHAALYGTLMAVSYWALRHWISFVPAFGLALGAALLLGVMTEVGQQFTGRAMALSDLLGNWLGAMTVAAVIAFGESIMHERQ